MQERIVGIMGAMPEEINGVVQLLSEKEEHSSGMRTYFTGKINGVKVVIVFSRWGKVAAATTVAHLILEYKITELIFTGVAGAISPKLKIGDIVIASRLVQHDLDARPLMRQFEIPLHGLIFLECASTRIESATSAVAAFLQKEQLLSEISTEELKQFGIASPQLHIGDIASGDKFFNASKDKNQLLKLLPETLCVEMEGAAVAQVCYEYSIPFTIIRTISDAADEEAHFDFPSFIQHISNKYSAGIIKRLI